MGKNGPFLNFSIRLDRFKIVDFWEICAPDWKKMTLEATLGIFFSLNWYV